MIYVRGFEIMIKSQTVYVLSVVCNYAVLIKYRLKSSNDLNLNSFLYPCLIVILLF